MSTTKDENSEEVQLLTGNGDVFSGITVDQKLLAKTPALFERQLEQSLVAWRQAKRRGIWFSIPHDRTELIPIAQKAGFVFHHARSDYIMLTHWLDEKDPNQLPSYAMSTLGVGGLVVNKKREVLVIQERFTDEDNYFKLPGGSLDMGNIYFITVYITINFP
jgi:8-oxo-dGTP diphosphatase